MNSREFLIDFHSRVHRSFSSLLDHCRNLTVDEFNREMDNFWYPTIRLQIHHVISAEKYWTGVLEGRIDADEDDHLYPTIESLVTYREEVFQLTEKHLESVSEEELITSRQMMTWGNREKVLRPIDIITRTQTHVYHHQGQILAMCKILGKPVGGLDYPID